MGFWCLLWNRRRGKAKPKNLRNLSLPIIKEQFVPVHLQDGAKEKSCSFIVLPADPFGSRYGTVFTVASKTF
ncbi:hypothetical protein C5167_023408 [Papaver somniferum]|uniref:Uncharacterized protein n=1 Tax=Papaver somniferum TaxID=3469 RepID=A0A4Y7JNM5_PAPSO|nr:hypothetical protein C5167_023408 [Papaver somniferum]